MISIVELMINHCFFFQVLRSISLQKWRHWAIEDKKSFTNLLHLVRGVSEMSHT